MCWKVYQLYTDQSHFGRGKLNRENDPTRLACEQACGTFSCLMCEGLVHCVDAATPENVVLGVIRKQAQQDARSKPVRSTPLWLLALVPASKFLP